MNTINPLLSDHVQMIHRERNGEAHPPHYLMLARVGRPTSPAGVPQRTRSANSGINLDSLSVRWSQVVKAYWWAPAGFAVLVLLRAIMGG